MKTIEEEKERLRTEFHKGTTCGCCGQHVKLYKRKFNSVMARTLIKLSHSTKPFTHVGDIVQGISKSGSSDFTKLAYWGMIEEMPNTDEAKKTSGFWRITQKGKDFASFKTIVQKHVFIYNTRFMGFSEETTTIVDALGEKFNYSELMNEEITFN